MKQLDAVCRQQIPLHCK